jgi:hypothetical protein
MGEDKSRKQTEQAAMADAKRKAIEKVAFYIKPKRILRILSSKKIWYPLIQMSQ